MIFLYLLTYFSVLTFVILVIAKIMKYAKTPVHIRWELYPVAHENNKYGGSYYEKPQWWKNKIKKNHLAEWWAMLEEILLLRGVYINNRKLWIFSFPFHFGLYLIVGTFLLIILSVILDLTSLISLSDPITGFAGFLHYLTVICGYAGLALTFIGSAGLLIQRMSDEKFKFYNTPMDYTNLIFIMLVVLSITLTLLYSNPSFIASKAYVKNLFTFKFENINNTFFVLHIILISLFLLYFPITRMMHLFAKYFLYHNVRWEDEPNFRGGKIEKRIKEALNFGVSWSAPHIQTGKTWAEVATTIPAEDEK